MTASPWTTRIGRVLDHIQDHFAEDLSPEQLAALAGFSLHHFHRVFRGLTGESVMGFVRRLRLEHAARRLTFTHVSVTEIALDSGYGSHEAFTRAFRARFGTSPRRWRADHSPPAEPVDVRFEAWGPRTGIAIRHVGPYATCGPAWEALFGLCQAQRLESSMREVIGICFDDPDVTPGPQLRFDAGVVLAGSPPLALPPHVHPFEVPGGRYAIATHHGAYETLNRTYIGLLGRTLPFRGVELTSEPVVEVYQNDPEETPPDELVTEICVRIL